MRAAIFDGPRDVSVGERPDPAHGAAPDRFMTHLAIWEAPDGAGRETEWGDLVSDEEYAVAPKETVR